MPLRPQDTTVAEVLKSAGYRTGIIGKWGLGSAGTAGVPNLKGFDEWYGYLDQQHAHSYYPDHLWNNNSEEIIAPNLGLKKTYSHDLFTARALSFLDGSTSTPFFLYLAYTIPHANNELGAQTGNGMEVPSDEPFTNRPWPQVEKNFAAMVTRLDKDVGRVLDQLKKIGVDDNTIVFFSSDNGPHREGGHDPNFFHSSGPLRGIKRDMYEGGIRAPMIVRWPGKVKAGAVSDFVWAFWDFLPTAAELAGAAAPRGLDGMSVAPTLLGRAQTAARLPVLGVSRGRLQAGRAHGRLERSAPRHQTARGTLQPEGRCRREEERRCREPRLVAQVEKILSTARNDSPEFPISEGRRPAAKSSAR